MKPINVETLSGRSTGVSDSYYRPTESELLEEYLKVAEEHLSISTEAKLRNELEIHRKTGSELQKMKEKYDEDMKSMYDKMNQIMEIIQQNPELANAKPEALARKKK